LSSIATLRPPTVMPPPALISSSASLNPFIWNTPGAASGPVSAVTMPMATLPWANVAPWHSTASIADAATIQCLMCSRTISVLMGLSTQSLVLMN